MQAPQLRGIILRAEGEELIVKASPADVARFAANKPADVRQRLSMSMSISASVAQSLINGAPWQYHVRPSELLYDRTGVAVAIVETVHITDSDSKAYYLMTHGGDVQGSEEPRGEPCCIITARGL